MPEITEKVLSGPGGWKPWNGLEWDKQQFAFIFGTGLTNKVGHFKRVIGLKDIFWEGNNDIDIFLPTEKLTFES